VCFWIIRQEARERKGAAMSQRSQYTLMARYIGTGIVAGLLLGAVVGLITGNFSLWISLGIVIGIVIGTLLMASRGRP